MPYDIRPMLANDIESVVRLDREILGQSIGEIMFRDELENNPFTTYFVMTDEDSQSIVGHIGVWVDAPLSQILNFYLIPEIRHQGLGETLLQYALTYLKSRYVNTLTLEVRPTNLAAIALYKKYGFRKVAVRKNYYHDGQDADLMLSDL